MTQARHNDTAMRSFADTRRALLAKEEVALLDVREEAPFAETHPLFAVNIPLSKLELQVLSRVQRHDTAITLYDSGEGLAQIAQQRLQDLSYSGVGLLEGGLQGWHDAGYESETGESQLASPRIDRYRRPYEGTDAPREAMQAYLDCKFGLVEQLGRDGTLGFFVI